MMIPQPRGPLDPTDTALTKFIRELMLQRGFFVCNKMERASYTFMNEAIILLRPCFRSEALWTYASNKLLVPKIRGTITLVRAELLREGILVKTSIHRQYRLRTARATRAEIEGVVNLMHELSKADQRRVLRRCLKRTNTKTQLDLLHEVLGRVVRARPEASHEEDNSINGADVEH